MGLYRTLRTAAESRPHDRPIDVATDLLGSLRKADLLELVAEEIASIQRTRTRGLEAEAFPPPRSNGSVSERLGVVDPLKALRSETFKLGDGREVEWLLATVDQHRQRVDYLERLRAGIAVTIDRHRQAIDQIESAGATCLADLGGGEAAAA
jgi:hypothetical protein